MEVTQVTSSDSFAVVGGGKSRNFRMGENASAFRILSDTLYSNKIRAVVREILCNAHDAHLEAGIDKPIEVKLTETELIIRDFGLGIADDNIQEIYTTYFNSSKTAQNALTGGFGLGSKAPFAYTDHFVVESRHDGIKTVYALHVGDEDSGGAPSIRIMSSTKCEDSGLCVRVPLEESKIGFSEITKFTEELREIAYFGGFAITLNGRNEEFLDYTQIINEDGFGILPRVPYEAVHNTSRYHRSEGIFLIKIGAVLYPLDAGRLDPSIQTWIKDIKRLSGLAVVIAAPPSLLSITPSREHLSYNEKTIAGLNKLLRRNTQANSKSIEFRKNKIMMEIVQKFGRRKYVLLNDPNILVKSLIKLGYMTTEESVVRKPGFDGLCQYAAVLEIIAVRKTRSIDDMIDRAARKLWKTYRRKSVYAENMMDHAPFKDVLRRFGRGVARVDPRLIESARFVYRRRYIPLNRKSDYLNSTGNQNFQEVYHDLAEPVVTLTSSFAVCEDGFAVSTGSLTLPEQARIAKEFERSGFKVKYIAPPKKKPVVKVKRKSGRYQKAVPTEWISDQKFRVEENILIDNPDYFVAFGKKAEVYALGPKPVTKQRGYGSPTEGPPQHFVKYVFTGGNSYNTHYGFIEMWNRLLRLTTGLNIAICGGADEVKRAVNDNVAPIDVLLEKKVMEILNPATSLGQTVLALMIEAGWCAYPDRADPSVHVYHDLPSSFFNYHLRTDMKPADVQTVIEAYKVVGDAILVICSPFRPKYIGSDNAEIKKRLSHYVHSLQVHMEELKTPPADMSKFFDFTPHLAKIKAIRDTMRTKFERPGLLKYLSNEEIHANLDEVMAYKKFLTKRNKAK
jgi:hypothetical protein